jgi:hypothetical protein
MRIIQHASNGKIILFGGRFAHEVIQNSHMQLIRVPTDEQLADIFTKALPFPQFEPCLMGLLSGDLKLKGH